MKWHLLTGEYPPQVGGVADYTREVATKLAAEGDDVHVWSPGNAGDTIEDGVCVHRSAGTWARRDRRRITSAIRAAGTGTVLVQWPHAFGQRSLNVGFCAWVLQLARAGAPVDVMVHEPFLSFRGGSWRQPAAAAVHRAMVTLILAGARRVWVSIPAWAGRLRPWLAGRDVPMAWLPVPSSVPVIDDDEGVARLRSALAAGARGVVGHFGTYGRVTATLLEPALKALARLRPDVTVVLMGRDSDAFRARLVSNDPMLEHRIVATGVLDRAALSRHLQSCDLMLQPYMDGASTRRGTLMAGLAHGLPVVSTLGHLSEDFWPAENGRAVTVVRAGDTDALVAAVAALLDDERRRHEAGAAARALYLSRFSIDHVVGALRAPAKSQA
jgi:glycosyltransferase involved in cell wall biosynthesis